MRRGNGEKAMHWGGCRGHLTSLRMQITPKQNILQCVQLFWFKGLLKSLNILKRKPGSWKWGEKKMGGKLPTKWEIVAQWFGQNGSHALRAERWEGTECRVLCSGIPIGVPDQSSNWSSDESAVEESWVEQCSELRVRWRWSGAGHSILEIKMPAANRCLQSLFKTSVCGVLCLHCLHCLHCAQCAPFSKFSSGEVASNAVIARSHVWSDHRTEHDMRQGSDHITTYHFTRIAWDNLTGSRGLNNTWLQFYFRIRANPKEVSVCPDNKCDIMLL